jgi:hypothetical protein
MSDMFRMFGVFEMLGGSIVVHDGSRLEKICAGHETSDSDRQVRFGKNEATFQSIRSQSLVWALQAAPFAGTCAEVHGQG